MPEAGSFRIGHRKQCVFSGTPPCIDGQSLSSFPLQFPGTNAQTNMHKRPGDLPLPKGSLKGGGFLLVPRRSGVWQVCSPNKPPISCEKCSILSRSQPIPPSSPNRSTRTNIPRSRIRRAIGYGAPHCSWSTLRALFRARMSTPSRVDATFLQCYARALVSNDACAPST
jgi:hypothetical protein